MSVVDLPATYFCRWCLTEKPAAAFTPVRGLKKRTRPRCLKCIDEYRTAHRKLPASQERLKEYRSNNKPYMTKYNRERHLRDKYGITSADYAAMVARQGGHCACCGGDPTARGLVVDHDHKTGKVRELLCEPCNQGIGCFRDSLDRLDLAAKYLQRHGL